jgi:hypothetical protein
MPFTQQYQKLFKSETSIGKTAITPKNIYRINSYQYASDGKTKSLSGNKAAIVFCIGIYQKKLTCIKITDINPTKFLPWLKTILKKGLKENDFDKAVSLDELCINSDIKGASIFNSYVKGKSIYAVSNEPTYRTYNISGIKSIEQIQIDPKVLKDMYGIKKPKEDTKKDSKTE